MWWVSNTHHFDIDCCRCLFDSTLLIYYVHYPSNHLLPSRRHDDMEIQMGEQWMEDKQRCAQGLALTVPTFSASQDH